MDDVRGDVLRPPHYTIPIAVKANMNKKRVPVRAMKTFIRNKMELQLIFFSDFPESLFSEHFIGK